ncbi:MAG: MFS transporter [Streptosporangiaceae bacterium]|nr:MFS transporter [Streptosporangiaceae bacterium]
MPTAPALPPGAAPRRAGTLRAEVADGLRLLRAMPLLRSTTIATTASQLTQGLLPVTLPLLAIRLGRTASGGGWLLTAISAGGLAGALASERLLGRRTPRAVLIASLGAFGGCLAVAALAPDFWLAFCVSVLAGIAEGPSLAATLAVRQQCVPPDRYAQTVATAASLKTGSYALGAAATGLLVDALTARQLLLAVAAGQLLAACPLLRPGLAAPAASGDGAARHRAARGRAFQRSAGPAPAGSSREAAGVEGSACE